LRNDTIILFPNFHSAFVDARQIEVWLPQGFDSTRNINYPLIIMQDGQNVFNASTSYTGIDWGVDEKMDSMVPKGIVPPALVVAVWNNGVQRYPEYMPNFPGIEQANAMAAKKLNGREVISDKYLNFLVQELIPFMRVHYHAGIDPETTCIMGSSMGGQISLRAICEYPQVFGKAACVSTHWIVTTTEDDRFMHYLSTHVPNPAHHKLYFDHGTLALDSLYGDYQKRVDSLYAAAGYIKGMNFYSEEFAGATHTESSWRARVEIPLQFLLKNR
jgi:enterochelin esterase-like enzyme